MRSLQFCFVLVLFFSGNAFGISRARVASMFEQFKTTHNKVYATKEEHELRKRVFNLNTRYIEQHNREYMEGLHTYELGVNQFADLTGEEFKKQYLSAMIKKDWSGVEVYAPSRANDTPDSLDWRDKGYVTDVQNQGMCGSCWAFSAVGAIEGAHFKQTGELVKLSEQDLVDCDQQSEGCQGGFMNFAFEEVIGRGGIDTEESYPYEGRQKECRFSNETIGATISSYQVTPSGDEDALKATLAEVGPISVAIDASPFTFQLYRTGIFSSLFCRSDEAGLNHGVLLVGYGSQKTLFHGMRDYWLIKNSWGKWWGDHGYIKILRNHKNMCGVATATSYPV